MRKQILGWAVIFTVTLLLSACASHEAQVSDTNTMSGPDATMAQTGEQELAMAGIDDTFTFSPTLTDEREVQQQALVSQDDTFTHQPSFTGEREFQLDQREVDLEWSQDAVAVAHVLLDERETRLDQREIGLLLTIDY